MRAKEEEEAVKVEAKRLDRQFGRGYGYDKSWYVALGRAIDT